LRYEFIRQEKEAYGISLLCKVMEVSRSSYYEYVKKQRLGVDFSQKVIEIRMRRIFEESRYTYGYRRLTKKLRSEGFKVGKYRVRGLMKKLGLRVKRARHYRVTTNSRHNYSVAPNLVDRQFDVKEANRVWSADITYVWTYEGWLYLAVIMDLFSRQIVGWAVGTEMNTKLVKDALAMAFWRRKPGPGLVHHSDRGSQYCSKKYQKQLEKYHMVASMSRKGDCWDNSPMERFFRSLKSEHLSFFRFATRKAARLEILDYITFYNSMRLHSTLGYLSPMEFEMKQFLKVA